MPLATLPIGTARANQWPTRLQKAAYSTQAANLVGWWPTVGQSGTNLTDYAGSNNLAGVNSPALVSDTRLGQVAEFVYASAQYYSASISAPSLPLTLTCWFNFGGAAQQSVGFGLTTSFSSGITSGSGYYLEAYDNATTQYIIANQRNTASSHTAYSSEVDAGDWHFFAGVFTSNSSRKAYTDGVLTDTGTTSASTVTCDRILIGGMTSATALDGQIADCRWYDSALTADQIAEIYLRPFDLYQMLGPAVSGGLLPMLQSQGLFVGMK